MIAFESPAAFLLLLLPALLFLLRKLGVFRRPSFPLTLADWNGAVFAWKGAFHSCAAVCSTLLTLVAYAALVTALASPVVHHQERVYTSRGSDILFVLDTSPSMAARDIANTTRLEAAKLGIRTLVRENRGASFALVAMGSEAAVVVPPTSDQELFFRRLDSFVIGAQGEGSAIGTGLSTAVYHLASSAAPKKCIVLITDGENNAGSIHPETAALLARENGITVYTFGIGTRGTVAIEYVDPHTGKIHAGYYESEFDTKPLEAIAALTGGRYFGVDSTAALAAALSAVGDREAVAQSYHLRTHDTQYYDRLLAVCLVCAALAWIVRRLFMQEIC